MLELILTLCALSPQTPAAEVGEGPPPSLFRPAVAVTVEGRPLRVVSPGYACPALYDLDGDGRLDLIVGQFRSGAMRVYPGLEEGGFGSGSFLQAGGKPATVPGIW